PTWSRSSTQGDRVLLGTHRAGGDLVLWRTRECGRGAHHRRERRDSAHRSRPGQALRIHPSGLAGALHLLPAFHGRVRLPDRDRGRPARIFRTWRSHRAPLHLVPGGGHRSHAVDAGTGRLSAGLVALGAVLALAWAAWLGWVIGKSGQVIEAVKPS